MSFLLANLKKEKISLIYILNNFDKKFQIIQDY